MSSSSSAGVPAPVSPLQALLARVAAGSWTTLGPKLFPGELNIATANSIYRFQGGLFESRAAKAGGPFECPKSMRQLRLIGFLREAGGLWSISPRWRSGAHAALWKPEEAETFVLTSPTHEFKLDTPGRDLTTGAEPMPSPWVTRPPSASSIVIPRFARPPSIRHPLPPSTTRIHGATDALVRE